MFDAIVLAGGTARRLGGIDKPAVEVDGVTLLDRVLAATDGANRVVVVGPERATTRPARWVREDPPGGGPVAGLAAGLVAVDATWCLVLAADLPWIADAVPRLVGDAAGHDVAVLEQGGRRNHLAACWRTASLRAAAAALPTTRNAAMRALYDGRDVAEVVDEHGWGHDCDTPADLEDARRRYRVNAS